MSDLKLDIGWAIESWGTVLVWTIEHRRKDAIGTWEDTTGENYYQQRRKSGLRVVKVKITKIAPFA